VPLDRERTARCVEPKHTSLLEDPSSSMMAGSHGESGAGDEPVDTDAKAQEMADRALKEKEELQGIIEKKTYIGLVCVRSDT